MTTTGRAIKLFMVLTFLTGLIYPLLVTLIGQTIFPYKANGSIIEKHGEVVGSELIGQNFMDDKYFWSRPSAIGYNPLPSGGSNLGPTSNVLRDSVMARKSWLEIANPGSGPIPNDLLYASGSGLDPDISPDAAIFQVERIARVRKLDKIAQNKLINLIDAQTQQPDFGILGEPRINVLRLNLALDSLCASYQQ